MSWIAAYKFDEASSGTTPTTAADSVASPVNLAVTYAGAGAWTSVTAGKGLNCVGGTKAVATAFGTKLATAISGSLTWAIEMVCSFPLADSGEVLGVWGSNPTYPLLHFQGNDQVAYYSSGNEIIEWTQTGLTGPHAVTHVWDSAQVTANNRFRVYIDGVQVPDNVSGFMTLNKTVSLASGDKLSVGQVEAGCPSGSAIYWLAVANHAPATVEVLSRATALLANNDADPGGGGGSTSSPAESAGARQLRQNSIYRMGPKSERAAQQLLRAQKRAYGFGPAP